MMVYLYQLVLLLKLIHHRYYTLTLYQMLMLQLNKHWCKFLDDMTQTSSCCPCSSCDSSTDTEFFHTSTRS